MYSQRGPYLCLVQYRIGGPFYLCGIFGTGAGGNSGGPLRVQAAAGFRIVLGLVHRGISGAVDNPVNWPPFRETAKHLRQGLCLSCLPRQTSGARVRPSQGRAIQRMALREAFRPILVDLPAAETGWADYGPRMLHPPSAL